MCKTKSVYKQLKCLISSETKEMSKFNPGTPCIFTNLFKKLQLPPISVASGIKTV